MSYEAPPKTVVGELSRRRAQLAALDREVAIPVGQIRLIKLRLVKADLLAEIDALELALFAGSSTRTARVLETA